MLTQYLSHDNETLSYMEHALYRLDKTKIAFENYRSINAKLFRPTFNYPKFHAMTHFLKCIQDYGSVINYDTAHSEVAHKYLLKAFYGRTNKKEYKSQILKHNIRHTNVIAMQDAILMAQVLDESAKRKQLIVDTPDVEVTWVCSATNVLLKYNWHLNPTDDKAAVDLGLQSVKKYWRRAAQVADELNHLQDFLPALAVFVNEARRDYDQKMHLDKRLRFRQDRDHEWVSSYFVKLHISIQCWKMDGKDIADTSKLVKEFVRCSLVWGGSSSDT